jgi:hypothetical protein
MAVSEQYLTNITVGGNPPGMAYGGYIFSARSESSFTSTPSKCTLRVIIPNSPNIKSPPKPSLVEPVTLSINKIPFRAFLLESKVEKTVGETIYDLTYCDQSVKYLDRHVIGLYKRAGYRPGVGGNLHLLGAEQSVKKIQDKKVCLDCLEKVVETQENVSLNTVCGEKDIVYSGQDFVEFALQEIGCAGGNLQYLYEAKNLSNVGSVREVLNSICSDLGLMWYWDWSDNTVNILNSEASVPNVNLNEPSITSYSRSLSKEGTFSSGYNEYSLVTNKSASLSAENYQQIILNYVGNTLDQDVVCGVLAQISKDLRDDYCYGSGQYYRLGFMGTVIGGGFSSVSQSYMKLVAEALGDKALWDIACTYDVWYFSIVDPELRNYYEARESGALQDYGKRFKVVSGNPQGGPSIDICDQGKYAKQVSYEKYPDFDDAGNWAKTVGVTDTKKKREDYKGRYPATVIPWIGQLKDVMVQGGTTPAGIMGYYRTNRTPITDTNAFSFIDENRNAAYSLIAFQGKPYGQAFGRDGNAVHPDEELIKPVNTGTDKCSTDPCGQTDSCDKFTSSCSNKGKGILQGSLSNIGWSYDGIVLPSTAPFYGWIKKSTAVERNIDGNLNIAEGVMRDGDYQLARYESKDRSQDGTALQKRGATGELFPQGDMGAGDRTNYTMAESLTVEYIGINSSAIINSGLTSFSFIIDSNGAFTSVTYSSRPYEPPKNDPVLGKVLIKKLAL